MRHPLVASLLFCLFAPSFAASLCAQAPLALGGLDPVALCAGQEIEGEADVFEDRGRYRYRFANTANRKRFRSDPERWGIQWGGACARMGPLSGRGSPDRYTVHEGRIYIFASDACRAGFLKAPDRYVPRADAEPVAASAAAIAKGREWIEKAVVAHGGAEAIDAKRALHLTDAGDRSGWTYRHQVVVTASGDVRRRSEWTAPEPDKPGYDAVMVVARDGSFGIENGGVVPLASAAERTDVQRFGHREPITLLWARRRPDFVPVHRGASKLDDEDVVDIAVRLQGMWTTLHLDPEDGTILGLSWRGRPAEGVTRSVTETFTKWLTVDGVKTPVGRTMLADGEARQPMSGIWDSVRYLDAVPAEAFRRPSADRAAVERAVKDYVEALYHAKPELIERSVHPALEKLGAYRPEGAEVYRVPGKMTFEQLVDLAGRWNKDGQQGEGLKYDIEVLDVLDITAAAKLTAKWGVDYMQLLKRDGRWKIVHVLWQSHPRLVKRK